MAIKVIDIESTEDDLEDIQQEVTFQSQCNDDYITRYFGSYIKGNELWIAMEYLGGGSVSDIVRPLFICFVCRRKQLSDGPFLPFADDSSNFHRSQKTTFEWLSAALFVGCFTSTATEKFTETLKVS